MNIQEDELVDIETVHIDENLSKEERIKSFLKQIKNPYCFKCKGVTVKVSFNENGKTFEECFKDYLKLKLLKQN